MAICDDEPLALERLERMLGQAGDVHVVGSYRRGEDLLAAVAETCPDLIFLDIEMPKLDGFDVIEALSGIPWLPKSEPPLVIFATAHPEFAFEAFESGALDFVAKPVRAKRLQLSLQRARSASAGHEARRRLTQLSDQLEELRRFHESEGEPQVWIRQDGAVTRLDPSQIEWIEAEGECVRYHAGSQSFLQRGSITAVAERLQASGFVRIHRSTVVNADRIVSVLRAKWGTLHIRLSGGTELRVSRSFESQVRQIPQTGITATPSPMSRD